MKILFFVYLLQKAFVLFTCEHKEFVYKGADFSHIALPFHEASNIGQVSKICKRSDIKPEQHSSELLEKELKIFCEQKSLDNYYEVLRYKFKKTQEEIDNLRHENQQLKLGFEESIKELAKAIGKILQERKDVYENNISCIRQDIYNEEQERSALGGKLRELACQISLLDKEVKQLKMQQIHRDSLPESIEELELVLLDRESNTHPPDISL